MMFSAWYSVFLLLLQLASSLATLARWPEGLYGLLKPKTGCPSGWTDNGWVFQNMKPSNERSEVLHIEGLVGHTNVFRYFCVKTDIGTTTDDTTSLKWPRGQYCIYRRKNKSLVEMQLGWIRMFDFYSSYNRDATALTGNIISINTRRRFVEILIYCSIKGDRKIPIELPITKPFYLLPYGSRECQQVKWMIATTEWIKYSTLNYVNRYWQKNGELPYHELGSGSNKGITMYYCYYKSCNYTVKGTKGVFQSPRFPHEYPDGQLCSWRIIVPTNHTMHVHFTNFSLYGNDEKDSLTFYKRLNGSFQLNYIFHGDKRPFTVTATNDVLIELLTNEENTSTGFRAEYTIFLPKATTTTSIPRTPNQDTTIRVITMAKNESSNRTFDKTFKKLPIIECDCDGTWTTIALVLPLVCLTVVVAIAIIFFLRCRSKETRCEKCQARFNSENAVNPTYDHAKVQLQRSQRVSTTTVDTTLDDNDNNEQMYQALSRDQQPEYEAPDYSKQNGIADSNIDSECPEYHELEPMDNDVPDVVYDVLEGPDLNGPSDDPTYQALDKKSTHNPLYQSANSTTMVTRNHLYRDSVA